MSFTWVPFYREVAARVLEYENRQDELLAILYEMKEQGLSPILLNDRDDQYQMVALAEIDPFTFFASWNRGSKDSSRLAICQFLKEKWNLNSAVPRDFDGIPTVNPQSSWFFAYLQTRESHDIQALWRIASAAIKNEIDEIAPAQWSQALEVAQVGVAKLTMGLFWIAPQKFLALDAHTVNYVRKFGVVIEKSALDKKKLTIERYGEIMDGIHQRLGNDNLKISLDAYNGEEETIPRKMPDFPLNQILYGPPGTGKTYGTIERAVEIIDGVAASSHVVAKVRFDELRKNGQIEFVTFHQSFSYEEFIEGLRPILDADGDGTARYEIRDGVLKTSALRALASALEKQDVKRATFDQLWNQLLEKIEDEDWILPGLGTSKFKLTVTSAGNLTGSNVAGKAETHFSASRAKVEKVWEALREEPSVTHATITQVLKVGAHTNLIGAVVEEIKRLSKQPKLFIAPQIEKSSESAQSFLNDSPDYRANFSNAPRYVLIVDEINRGNISKILGELITLLEPDKRISADNELRVQLPVSGEPFGLPPNLYLLGTMNTADKSLALLDVALRRRFDFIEIAPDSSLFPSFARDVLIQLNLRLEVALDREHRIGHAYFIGCVNEDDFNAVFRAKIIPLLQEFFYNDWETLRAVLGESGDSGRFIKKLVAPSGLKARTKWRWWLEDEGEEKLDILEVLRTNYS